MLQEFNGEQLASLREKLGLTQNKLANLMGVGRSTVARWEANKLNIPPIYPMFLALKFPSEFDHQLTAAEESKELSESSYILKNFKKELDVYINLAYEAFTNNHFLVVDVSGKLLAQTTLGSSDTKKINNTLKLINSLTLTVFESSTLKCFIKGLKRNTYSSPNKIESLILTFKIPANNNLYLEYEDKSFYLIMRPITTEGDLFTMAPIFPEFAIKKTNENVEKISNDIAILLDQDKSDIEKQEDFIKCIRQLNQIAEKKR